eukprot:885325-Lingulodinium_polyedra.AAC.1
MNNQPWQRPEEPVLAQLLSADLLLVRTPLGNTGLPRGVRRHIFPFEKVKPRASTRPSQIERTFYLPLV